MSAALVPGKTIGDGIDAMERIADEVLDDNFATTLAGESRDFAESSTSLVFVFVLALVLVYLVLAAQFESFRDPLIIMFTVPLALAGALFSLWYFNQTINIFSQIGMIMLDITRVLATTGIVFDMQPAQPPVHTDSPAPDPQSLTPF